MSTARSRRDGCRAALAGLLLASLTAGPAASAEPGLANSNPDHFRSGAERHDSRLPQPPRAGHPIPRYSSGLLLHEGPRAVADLVYERELSRACRAGRFGQVRDRLYVVRLAGEVHGAVQGGRLGLFDPDRLARPDVIYAVRAQDTAYCRIYRVGLPGRR